MARLELNEVKERLQRINENPTLRRARQQDSRLKLHTEAETNGSFSNFRADKSNETFLSRGYNGNAYEDLAAWIKTLIDADKYRTFEAILRFPIGTVEVTDSIFSKVEKIFESEGFFLDLQFTTPELAVEAEEFRSELDSTFWRRNAFYAFKSAINSFLVVDVDAVQDGDHPKTYYNLVDVSKVVDVVVNDDEVCEHIIFYDKEDIFIYVDDLYYRTFLLKDGEYEMLTEVTHDLGYCPARSFWSDRISLRSWEKKNIITASLSNLDWLFLLQEGQKHLETYATWPIFAAYEQKCDYNDPETGASCEGGKTVYYSGDDTNSTPKYKDCPECTNRHLFGPGTSIEAVAPATKDEPDTLEGVKWIEAPIKSLENVAEKIEAKTNEIIKNSIGAIQEPSKQQINEKQVSMITGDRETVLNNVVENFELIHRWALKTALKLRHGDKFLGLVLNYGRKHILRTADELKENYAQARKEGLPFHELESMRENIYSSQYKNNPIQKIRAEILSEIEPLQDYSIEEVNALNEKGQIDFDDFVLKSNFTNFIKQFERENMDIVSFMSGVPMDVKIELIKEQLNEYVEQKTKKINDRRAASSQEAPTGGNNSNDGSEQA